MWNLTGGAVHATDVSNASRTMIFNINTMEWDDDLLDILNIPKDILPEVGPSSHNFGSTTLLGGNITIGGVAGDQQSALFGQACFSSGMAKNTYGTGCFMLMNTGTEIIQSQNGLLSTVAWQIDDQVVYALEGSVFVAGASIQWLRDELKILNNSEESESLATEVDTTDGVYLVPGFTGLGAPYWDMEARGMIVGLTRGSNRNHIIRAALEAMAYQTKDVLEAMQSDAETKLSRLRVDGGASTNNFLMQFQADMLQVPVERPASVESTALGCAYLAGINAGLYDKNDIEKTAGSGEVLYT